MLQHQPTHAHRSEVLQCLVQRRYGFVWTEAAAGLNQAELLKASELGQAGRQVAVELHLQARQPAQAGQHHWAYEQSYGGPTAVPPAVGLLLRILPSPTES